VTKRESEVSLESSSRRQKGRERTKRKPHELEISRGVFLGLVRSSEISLESIDLSFSFLSLAVGFGDLLLLSRTVKEDRRARRSVSEARREGARLEEEGRLN